MDKYICINVMDSDRLTFGKTYVKLNIPGSGYDHKFYNNWTFMTTNDRGENIFYDEKRFVTLDEYRELQINNLLYLHK